jgi:hypothetical protein
MSIAARDSRADPSTALRSRADRALSWEWVFSINAPVGLLGDAVEVDRRATAHV